MTNIEITGFTLRISKQITELHKKYAVTYIHVYSQSVNICHPHYNNI